MINYQFIGLKRLIKKLRDEENRIMSLEIKRKLTSRKFWAAVIGFVTPLMLMFNIADSDITKVTAVIMAGGTLVAYIIGEGMVDAANISNTQNTSNQEDDETR